MSSTPDSVHPDVKPSFQMSKVLGSHCFFSVSGVGLAALVIGTSVDFIVHNKSLLNLRNSTANSEDRKSHLQEEFRQHYPDPSTFDPVDDSALLLDLVSELELLSLGFDFGFRCR